MAIKYDIPLKIDIRRGKVLHQRLTRFISHKKIIFKHSNLPYYRNLNRLNSIDRINIRIEAVSIRLLPVARAILSLETDLRNILPYHENSQYQASLDSLEELVRDAEILIKLFTTK